MKAIENERCIFYRKNFAIKNQPLLWTLFSLLSKVSLIRFLKNFMFMSYSLLKKHNCGTKFQMLYNRKIIFDPMNVETKFSAFKARQYGRLKFGWFLPTSSTDFCWICCIHWWKEPNVLLVDFWFSCQRRIVLWQSK